MEVGSNEPSNESNISERFSASFVAPRFEGSPTVSFRALQRRFAVSRPSMRIGSDAR